MGIHKIKYAIRSASGISRFDFYCAAQDSAEALQKFSDFMDLNPGNYRSISGGWEVPQDEVPKCICDARVLDGGTVVRLG